jgi:predicted glycosyltransferase
MKPVLLVYCQHSMGLGHLVRSWAIADALSAAFRVVFVTGGEAPAGMTPPRGVEMVTLPALQQTAAGEIVTAGAEGVAAIQERRRRLLLETFAAADPDVVVIELFPFGRAKFADEILPILERARARRPRPIVICSLRDLLAGGRKNQQQHDDRARALADRYFDAVLVHADSRLATLEETFKPTTPLGVPVIYTGFVTAAQPPTLMQPPRRSGVVVSAGGGRVGGPLFRAAVDAHLSMPARGRVPMRIVTGPFLPDAEFADLVGRAGRCADLVIDRSLPSLRPLLARAAISVSQCGYNTALELVQLQVPALVVPFAEGREDEQRARARRLAALGAVRVLDPDALTAASLAEMLDAMRDFVPAPLSLDTDGANVTVQVISALQVTLPHDVLQQAGCAW